MAKVTDTLIFFCCRKRFKFRANSEATIQKQQAVGLSPDKTCRAMYRQSRLQIADANIIISPYLTDREHWLHSIKESGRTNEIGKQKQSQRRTTPREGCPCLIGRVDRVVRRWER